MNLAGDVTLHSDAQAGIFFLAKNRVAWRAFSY